MFIAFAAAYVNRENWEPFLPPSEGPGKYGWGGVLRGAGVIFFAYIGFDAVSTAAQESRNPQARHADRHPRSLAICTVLYIIVSLVLTGIVKYTELNVPDPIAVGINAAGPALAWLRPIVKIGAIAGLSSVILVMLLGQPRIFFSMSRDGLLPPAFGEVHPRFRTPWLATILTGFVAMLSRRPVPHRAAGRAGLDRHAPRVRDRVRGGAGVAPHRSPPAAAVQSAALPGGADCLACCRASG